MNTRTTTLYLFGFIAMLGLAYACTTPPSAQTMFQGSPIVEIDRETHFLTPAGEDVVVFPGAYLVQAEKEGLRLIAKEGTSSESVMIEATSTTHEQALAGPTAVTLSDNEDENIVALLMPDGKSLEATGSHSGVLSRAAPRAKTSQSRIKQALDIQNKILIPTPPIALSATWVRYATLNKTYQGAPSKSTWRLPVSDTVANASFTFVWSGSPTPPFQIPEITQIVNTKGCCLTLFVDNQPQTTTPRPPYLGGQSHLKSSFTAAFDRGGNLVTTVYLNNARSNTWPKNIRLAITSGKKQWQSANYKVYANPISYYGSELHPIFSHDRCTTCHTLGDHDSIVAMHQSRLGAASYPYENEPEAKPHNPSFCANCHSVSDWKSPSAVQGINWQGKNANQVCSIVTGPKIDENGGQHPPFNATEFQFHFHDDPRILWAVSDGATPSGSTLSTPFPGNTNSWFKKVDPWVAAGTPCPQKLFFQIPGRIQPGQFTPRR